MTDYQFCPTCTTALIEEERGGALRKVCTNSTCGFVFWNNPTPVVGAIVEHPDGVVLVQSIGWPSHFYGLVTGFLEFGEVPNEAVLREVKEETGLDAELGEFIGFYSFERMNQLIMVYHVRASGEVTIAKDELADFKIVPLDNLRPWKSSTGYALNDWLVAQGYSPQFLEIR